MIYAGIGSRKTPPSVLKLMQRTAYCMAIQGHELRTGACKGADQAFAEGAVSGNGKVTLCLPWRDYEKEWVSWMLAKYRCNVEILDTGIDIEAFESVKKYHPAYNKLSNGVKKLHARNYLIMNGVEAVICWTPSGQVVGGTGQALRIAIDRGIKIYNLGNTGCRNRFEVRLKILKTQGLIWYR